MKQFRCKYHTAPYVELRNAVSNRHYQYVIRELTCFFSIASSYCYRTSCRLRKPAVCLCARYSKEAGQILTKRDPLKFGVLRRSFQGPIQSILYCVVGDKIVTEPS